MSAPHHHRSSQGGQGERCEESDVGAAAFQAVLRAARRLQDASSSGGGVRHELVREAGARGDHAAVEAATRGFRALFQAREGVLGPEHPDTLDARHDVARLDMQRGDLDAAEAGFRAVLEAREHHSGPEHPETLAAWHNLAAVHLRRGRWDEAEAGFRAVLAARERVNGAQHPHTLIVRHELAVLALKRGRRAEADREFRALLAVCRNGREDAPP